MRDIDLFQMALGLIPPWFVDRSEFDADEKRLDLYLDFSSGGRFTCPECGRDGCAAYDSEEKTWRHLNFFQHETSLHARPPASSAHSVESREYPFLGPEPIVHSLWGSKRS